MSLSWPYRCDEFPAEYSLASCSPAELASASSAASSCNQQPPFVELSSANGNRGVSVLSHPRGSLQIIWLSCAEERKLKCLFRPNA
jgi:hypothetical protein